MVQGIVGSSLPASFLRGVSPVAPRQGGHDARPERLSSESSAAELKVSSITADRFLQQVDDDPATALSVNSATQLAFRVRSQSKVRVDDDGSLRAVNKTQLRFSYDLESEDGQRIQLRVKAKVKESVTLDENGDIAVKTRVKLQFSLIQKDISDGLSPLQSAQDDGDSNPLQAFLDVVDSVVSDYADDGQIDADTLISTVLDEFNSLFANLSGGSLAPIDAATIDGDVIDALPQPSSPPDAEAGVEEVEAAAPVQPTSPETETDVEGEGTIFVAEPLATGLESNARLVSAPLTEITPVGETDADPVRDSFVNAADAETKVETANDILQQVRIRFVQSFTQVIKTLTPNSEDDSSGLSLVQKSSFKFDARVQYNASNTLGSATDFIA